MKINKKKYEVIVNGSSYEFEFTTLSIRPREKVLIKKNLPAKKQETR